MKEVKLNHQDSYQAFISITFGLTNCSGHSEKQEYI